MARTRQQPPQPLADNAAAIEAARKRREYIASLGGSAQRLKPGQKRRNEEALEGPTLTEKRIDVIVEEMVNGMWVTGISHRELAQAWGLSLDRIEGLASEAYRLVRRLARETPQQTAEMRTRIVLSLERIARKAEGRGSRAGYRDALEGYKLLAQVHGLLREKVEVEHTNGNGPFEGWSREEKQHFADTGELPARLRGESTEPDVDEPPTTH